jgi:hypothetical protein
MAVLEIDMQGVELPGSTKHAQAFLFEKLQKYEREGATV